MPNRTRPRRINVDRAHDPTDFLIVIDFGRGRWPRVPPWRPRPPVPPPRGDGLPQPLSNAELAGSDQPPTLIPSRQLEDA